MSRTLGLFIASPTPLESFSGELEALLSLSWTRAGSPSEPRMEWRGEGFDMILSEHEFKNYQDLAFQNYKYYLCLCPHGSQTPESAARLLDAAARRLFETLRLKGHWPLLLVEDVNEKLAEYAPRPQKL